MNPTSRNSTIPFKKHGLTSKHGTRKQMTIPGIGSIAKDIIAMDSIVYPPLLCTSFCHQRLAICLRLWVWTRRRKHHWMKCSKPMTKNHSNCKEQGNIRSCFNDLSYFLMPYPGEAVTEKNFDGRINSIGRKFLDQLETLVPLVLLSRLSRNSLVLKSRKGS